MAPIALRNLYSSLNCDNISRNMLSEVSWPPRSSLNTFRSKVRGYKSSMLLWKVCNGVWSECNYKIKSTTMVTTAMQASIWIGNGDSKAMAMDFIMVKSFKNSSNWLFNPHPDRFYTSCITWTLWIGRRAAWVWWALQTDESLQWILPSILSVGKSLRRIQTLSLESFKEGLNTSLFHILS